MIYMIYERETGEIHWEISSNKIALRICNNGIFGYQPRERRN